MTPAGLLLLILSLLLTAESHARPEHQAALDACPIIRIAGGEWLEWTALKDTASGTGRSLRLIELINTELPVELVATPEAPFPRQMVQLRNGDMDAMFGIFPLNSRLLKYAFTNSYFKEAMYIYMEKTVANRPTSIEELKPLQGVAVRGVSYGNTIDKLIKEEPGSWTLVAKHFQAVAMVVAGRKDFFVGSLVSEDFDGERSKVTRSKLPIGWQDTNAAFSLQTPCKVWIPAINVLITKHF
jgi:ABC-type amino acid transport substrate-binding protein